MQRLYGTIGDRLFKLEEVFERTSGQKMYSLTEMRELIRKELVNMQNHIDVLVKEEELEKKEEELEKLKKKLL